jgi:hypothetical protein
MPSSPLIVFYCCVIQEEVPEVVRIDAARTEYVKRSYLSELSGACA